MAEQNMSYIVKSGKPIEIPSYVDYYYECFAYDKKLNDEDWEQYLKKYVEDRNRKNVVMLKIPGFKEYTELYDTDNVMNKMQEIKEDWVKLKNMVDETNENSPLPDLPTYTQYRNLFPWEKFKKQSNILINVWENLYKQ